MKVIIYGLGREGIFASRIIKKKHTILGFTDSFANIESYCGYRYFDRNEWEDIECDYIIIALNSKKNSGKVKQEMMQAGIGCNAIVDFYELIKTQKIDKVMSCSDSGLDGLILGISHAAVGINTDYLDGKWCNLASPCEDLYYHYRVLEKCEKVYSTKIQNLKYAVIDLFDYTIFNYDTSMSSVALMYWGCGGYMEDLHNFAHNTCFSGSVEEEMYSANYYLPVRKDDELKLSEELFDKALLFDFIHYMDEKKLGDFFGYSNPLQMQLTGSISKEPSLQYNLFTIGEQSYPDTKKENIFYLEKTITLLKKINPQIKIIFLLLPRYGRLELYHSYILKNCMEEFEELMKPFLKQQNCYLFNYKNKKEISNNPHFYCDPAHLNYMGAIAFSDMLNRSIHGLNV